MPPLPCERRPFDSAAITLVSGRLLPEIADPLLGQRCVLPLQRGRVPLPTAPLLLGAALLLVVALFQVRKLPFELVHGAGHGNRGLSLPRPYTTFLGTCRLKFYETL